LNLDLAIVIVSWNVRELLEACLTSVYESLESSNLRGEVWVVDNASTDGSAEMVGERFPQARLVVNETNVGFAAANNQALRAIGFASTGPHDLPRYVLLLNPDTEVLDDALSTMVRFLDENPQSGVAGAEAALSRWQLAAFSLRLSNFGPSIPRFLPSSPSPVELLPQWPVSPPTLRTGRALPC